MKNPKLLVLGLFGAVFIIGAGVIVYKNMPVNQLSDEDLAPTTSAPHETTNPNAGGDTTATDTSGGNTFTIAQVQSHNTPDSCWSTINGSVYDLTTWISRHPGGPGPIKYLCGIDGTEAFTRQHGRSRAAQSALALLKIGTLTQ